MAEAKSLDAGRQGVLRFALIETLGDMKTGWSRWWPVVVSILWVFIVGGFVRLWWFVGNRTTSEDDVLIRFLDSLVGIGSFALAGAVTIATIYSVARTDREVKRARNREARERWDQRRGRIDALIASSLEVGAYGAWMAHLQYRGLRTWRRLLPEPVAQRELAIASWRQLSSAAVAASKALERIRYEDPDVAELAGAHYDLVLDLQEMAFQGELSELEHQAQRIRRSADDLWRSV